MKVAFFSNAAGRGAVTSNLACIAVMGALCHKRRMVLFENHYNMNSLEHAFFQGEVMPSIREKEGYLCEEGLDGIMRGLHSGFMRPSMVRDSVMSVMKRQLYFLPGSHIMDGAFFSHEFGRVMKPLFLMLEDFCENVFIDTGGANNESTGMILEEADLVVANISQDPSGIQDFFGQHGNLLDKTVFLIGGYQKESRYNLENLVRRYPIHRKNIGVIPYNVELHDAIQEGRLVSFLTRNYRKERSETHGYFMEELKKASALIFQAVDDRKAGEKRIVESA